MFCYYSSYCKPSYLKRICILKRENVSLSAPERLFSFLPAAQDRVWPKETRQKALCLQGHVPEFYLHTYLNVIFEETGLRRALTGCRAWAVWYGINRVASSRALWLRWSKRGAELLHVSPSFCLKRSAPQPQGPWLLAARSCSSESPRFTPLHTYMLSLTPAQAPAMPATQTTFPSSHTSAHSSQPVWTLCRIEFWSEQTTCKKITDFVLQETHPCIK